MLFADEHVHDTAPASPDGAQRVPLWLKVFGSFAVLCLVAMLVTYLLPAGRFTDTLVTLLDYPAMVFAVAALLFARSRGRGKMGTIWGLFALGAATWLVGNVVFEISYGLGDGPGISIADLFFLLYYVPIMAGLYLLAREDRGDRPLGNPLDVVIVMGAAALLLWVLNRDAVLTLTGDLLTQATAIAYVALDVGVLWLLILPVFRSDVIWTRSRTLLTASFTGILVADTMWSITQFDLYDLIVSSAIALLGISAVQHPNLTDRDPAKAPQRRLVAELTVVGAGAAGVGLMAWLAIGGDNQVDLALAVSALLCLVLVRLLQAVAKNERLLRESEHRAGTDPLTGLLNHVSFHEHLSRELSRADRGGEPLTLLYADVDYFKTINDLAGHREGDRVLAELADLLRATCRETDLVCRIGGDEMAVIAPATDLAQAGELARRLLQAVHTIRVAAFGDKAQVSISIGASEFPDLAPEKPELTEQADAALYWAKQDGRDRWRAFDPRAGQPHGTERQIVAAHAQLAARDSDFRAVFTHALEPMIIADRATTILDANDAAVSLAEVSREALVGRRLDDFVTNADKVTLSRTLAQMEITSSQRGQLNATLPSGRNALIEFSASWFSPQRSLVGLRDITAHAQAERRLELSESRFRALFDGAPDAILITDDDGLILDVNPAAVRLAGRSRTDLLGTAAQDLISLEGQHLVDRARDSLQREGTFTGTAEVVDATGRSHLVEYSSVSHFVLGQHLSIVRDITGRTTDTPDVASRRATATPPPPCG